MNLKQLRNHVRTILSDPNGVLWLDTELNSYLNEAERQFCRKGLVLRSNLSVNLTASTATYSLPDRALNIYRAKVIAASLPMNLYTQSEMDARVGNWDSTSNTTNLAPQNLIKAYPSDTQFTVHPIPTATSVLTYTSVTLSCFALPAAEMTTDTSSPSITSHLHLDMCDYALSMAFSKEGLGTKNPEKEAGFLAKFLSKADQARRESLRQLNTDRPKLVKYY